MREAELPPERWVRGYLPGLFTEAAPPELLEEAVTIMADARPAAMRTMARAFAEADLRDVLGAIRVPVLLLYGEADRRSPLGAVAAELHREIPGSRLVILPGVGHAAGMEAPERFNAEVRGFLRSLR
jgi:pimeloyl-ACP methyl ester carboxylesterase